MWGASCTTKRRKRRPVGMGGVKLPHGYSTVEVVMYGATDGGM